MKVKGFNRVELIVREDQIEQAVVAGLYTAHASGGRLQQQTLMEELASRLRDTGYEVWCTPFGYFCSWDIAVAGESLGKVFLGARVFINITTK